MEWSVVAGVVLIGLIHGVLPDHGWPIAATYALERPRRFFHGFLAASILGIGHLVSSVVLVLAYFWVSGFASFAEGPWLKYVAGTLLIGLGVYEYRYGGHGHVHEHDHENGGKHEHDDHSHQHDDHGHTHLDESHAERGLFTLGTTALVLGFAHEEPIQILAICIGTDRCLELMLIYSLAVIGAIIAPTLLLIAGYERHRETVERYTPYLPALTATVLVLMGLAFITGVV
ncbi:ABC transporter permease [Natrialbaceae archaeon A-chndr2]